MVTLVIRLSLWVVCFWPIPQQPLLTWPSIRGRKGPLPEFLRAPRTPRPCTCRCSPGEVASVCSSHVLCCGRLKQNTEHRFFVSNSNNNNKKKMNKNKNNNKNNENNKLTKKKHSPTQPTNQPPTNRNIYGQWYQATGKQKWPHPPAH